MSKLSDDLFMWLSNNHTIDSYPRCVHLTSFNDLSEEIKGKETNIVFIKIDERYELMEKVHTTYISFTDNRIKSVLNKQNQESPETDNEQEIRQPGQVNHIDEYVNFNGGPNTIIRYSVDQAGLVREYFPEKRIVTIWQKHLSQRSVSLITDKPFGEDKITKVYKIE